MDTPEPETVPQKSRGKRALEILPELLEHIEYLCTVLVKEPERSDAYRKGVAIVNEK